MGSTSSVDFRLSNPRDHSNPKETSFPQSCKRCNPICVAVTIVVVLRYTSSHNHMGGNPYTGAGCIATTTSLVSRAGASRATYGFTSQNFCCCTYHIIPNCNVRCGPPDVSRAQVSACAPYIQRIQSWYEVYGYTVCVPSPIFFVDFASSVPFSDE